MAPALKPVSIRKNNVLSNPLASKENMIEKTPVSRVAMDTILFLPNLSASQPVNTTVST